MCRNILDIISTIKLKYEAEGFIIIGVFGSVARGDASVDSDVDILYKCDVTSLKKHSGLQFFALYEQVKVELESLLGRKVDLADIKGLNEIGQKYILPEVQYVR